MAVGIEVQDEVIEVTSQEEQAPVHAEQAVTKGDKGDPGASAYELAVANGFEGTEEEWIESLNGQPGKPGNNGTSPTVSVEAITGGHRITITDVNGTKTIDVMNGSDGEPGSGADITSENIITALGYNPVSQDDIPTTAEEVGARPDTWTPTASDVGADPSGTAEGKMSEHNTNKAAHNDIRLLIEGLTTRLNALVPTHKSTPRKPQTIIVNDCQDSTKYKGSGLTANTTDHILGTQCVNVTGYIRFTENVFDCKSNHLVVKIKLNSLSVGARLIVKMKMKSSEANVTLHEIMRGTDQTIFGEWREYTIPYSTFYDYGGDISAIDYEAINDIIIGFEQGSGNFDVQFLGLRPNTQSKGIVTFTFDDGYKSQYLGIKTLAERGLTGTIFHIVNSNDVDYLSTAELQELVNYYGADIEVHTNEYFGAITEEEIVELIKDSQKFLRENGLSDGRHFAYAGGNHPTNAVNIVKKYFDSARTIDSFTPCETYPPYDNHRIRALSSIMPSHVEKVKQRIDECVANNTWLILVFHKIDTGTTSMSCTAEALAEIADYAITSGARIMNMAEVFETNGGGGGGASIDDIINALPVYNGEVV